MAVVSVGQGSCFQLIGWTPNTPLNPKPANPTPTPPLSVLRFGSASEVRTFFPLPIICTIFPHLSRICLLHPLSFSSAAACGRSRRATPPWPPLRRHATCCRLLPAAQKAEHGEPKRPFLHA